MLNCLTGAVGITNTDCACINGGLTEAEKTAAAVSNSGLYLDDLPGGVHLKALKYADACRNLVKMGTEAIDNATKTLESDLVVALNNRYAKSKKSFVGDIGRMSYSGTLGISKRWQGLKLEPWEFSDGLITLNRLNIVVNQTRAFDLKIIRVQSGAVQGDEVASVPINSVANMWFTHNFPTPLKLPLVYNGVPVEYWFLYDTGNPSTFSPKDNKIECSTCDGINSAKLGEFLSVRGVQVDATDALHTALTDTYAHGISLSVQIKCDNETLFCREYSQDDAVAVTMAYAAWFKAGELLIEDVLKQPDVNRYTTMAREYLWGKRNHFRKEYDTRITYLAEVINVEDSNCYVCRESANKPFIAGIYK